MIIVNHGVVQLQQKSKQEFILDTKCAIGAFIKAAKNMKISDELIEKTLIKMIADGFQELDDIELYDINKLQE